MILVELALQGVKGFPPQVRMALKAGLNVFRSSDANVRGALVDGIYHSLFPDPARGSATAHLVGGNPSRIALTFFGRDKITYRVLREAQNGATKLYKFEPAQNQYELFTEVAQEVAQYIRVQQRIPDEVGYERLFMFTRETMPSKGVKGRTRSGAAAVATSPTTGDIPMFGAPPRGATPTGFGSSMNMTNALVRSEMDSLDLGLDEEPEVPSGGSFEDKQRQLADLRDEYQAAFRAEQAQAEIDQLAARRFELTEKGERVKKIEAERTRLMELFEKESVLRSLPIGFAQRIEKFDELQKKHDAEMSRAQAELAALQGEESGLHVVGLTSDPYFMGGAIGAVAFFALAIWMSIPWLAWLNVLSMVVAAGAAFRFVGDLEHKHKLGIRMRSASDRIERLDRQFGDDSRQARDLMRKLEIDTPQELLDRIRGYEKLQSQIRVAEDALKALMADPEIAAAKRETDQINLRVEALEGEVLGATSAVSAETLRKRIQTLERELGPERAMSGPAPRSASGAFFPPPTALPRPDSFRTGDIPKVEPFAPAGGHRKPAPRAPDDDDGPGYGGGYGTGSGRGPSRGGSGGGGTRLVIGDDQRFEPLLAATRSGSGPFNPGGMIGYGGGSEDGAPIAPDRSRDLFQVAKDLLAVDVDDLAQRIRPRLGQYLGAFTDKRYSDASFGARGELTVIAVQGDPVAYTELPEEVLDGVDSALRFTLIEACLQQARVPVIIDDPFTRVSERNRRMFGQMLGYLASATQVVVLTELGDIPGQPVTFG